MIKRVCWEHWVVDVREEHHFATEQPRSQGGVGKGVGRPLPDEAHATTCEGIGGGEDQIIAIPTGAVISMVLL